MKTYRKENGDLNIDIEALIKEYPEIAGATDDDAEQRVIGVALVPYLIEELNIQRAGIEKLITQVSGEKPALKTVADKLADSEASIKEAKKLKEDIESNKKLIKVSLILLAINASVTVSAIAAFLAS